MRIRTPLSLVLAAALAACTTADTPTGVSAPDEVVARSATGVKPPPPLGSDDTEIIINSPVTDDISTASGGPSALDDGYFSGTVKARYFANTQSTNGWVQFLSGNGIVASANARLQYNEKTGKTTGNGTLTDADGTVMFLSLVEIIVGQFGPCPDSSSEISTCAQAVFEYNGIPGGSLLVLPATF